MTIIVVIAWFVSLAVAIFAVPRLARGRLVDFLDSEKSDPLWDRAAERVMVKLEPRITEMEGKIPGGDIQLDPNSLVAAVSATLMPQVRDEIERVRATIDGHMGWLKNVGKNTGEAVATAAANGALVQAGVSPEAASVLGELDALLSDEAWVKENRAAAVGLRLIKSRATAEISGSSASSGYAPGHKRR